jgi:hypothetical protein
VANFEDTGLPHSAGVPYFPPSQGGSPGPIDAGPGVAWGHATVPLKFQSPAPVCRDVPVGQPGNLTRNPTLTRSLGAGPDSEFSVP